MGLYKTFNSDMIETHQNPSLYINSFGHKGEKKESV